VDLAGRLMADGLARALGARVVVENQPGGGGSIGSGRVARAAPDGYTLLSGAGYLPPAAAFIANLSYDPVTSFTPIGLLARETQVLVLRRGLPAPQGLADLAAWLRQQADGLSFASAGVATTVHQCALVLAHRVGATPIIVPYRGGGPAIQAVMAGEADLGCPPVSTALTGIRDGRLRAIAVSAPTRATSLPDVPTIAEAFAPRGDAGAVVMQWYGLLGPAGLPAPIVARLGGALQAMLTDPALLARLAALGAEPFEPENQGGAAMARLIANDAATIGAAARAMGVRPE
jgi:tripartite-type tricarboxylate transporter receptor subunit TctC